MNNFPDCQEGSKIASNVEANTLAEVMVGIDPTLDIAVVYYQTTFDVLWDVHELFKVKGIRVAMFEKHRDLIAVDTDSDTDC